MSRSSAMAAAMSVIIGAGGMSFSQEVDPLIKFFVTFALVEQPPLPALSFLELLHEWKQTLSSGLPIVLPNLSEKSSSKPSREAKLFFVQRVVPVISKLTNRAAVLVTRHNRAYRAASSGKLVASQLEDQLPGNGQERVVDMLLEELTTLAEEEGWATRIELPHGGTVAIASSVCATETFPALPLERPRTAVRLSVSLMPSQTDFCPSEKQSFQGYKDSVADHKPSRPHTPEKAEASTKDIPLPTPQPITPAPPLRLQLAVLGIQESGKSTLVNILQGKISGVVRPTIGFRPVTLSLDLSSVEKDSEITHSEANVSLYDLGGGPKIRDIWSQYYHDVHGVVYVVDGSVRGEKLRETLRVAEDALNHPLLIGKPTIIMVNKQDCAGARPSDVWSSILTLPQLENEVAEGKEFDITDYYFECSSAIPTEMCDDESLAENFIPDSRIEVALEALLSRILKQFSTLDARVQMDCKSKAAEEAKKRLARERKVLRSKIASAFYSMLSPEIISEFNVEPDTSDRFDENEGNSFLAGEIGVETLCEESATIASLVGYQRLALQMIGALYAPISKKKTPLTWPEIRCIVDELRGELGL